MAKELPRYSAEVDIHIEDNVDRSIPFVYKLNEPMAILH